MRVVVTGASGNVGTAVLRWLAEEPDVTSVVGVVRHPPAASDRPEYADASWHAVDIGAADAADRLTKAFAGADAVVHLAFQITADHDRDRQRRTNRQGSAAVLDAVRRADVGHLTFLSSAAVYSSALPGSRADEDWPRRGIPGSPYSEDKVAVEDMLDQALIDTPDLRVARIRPPSVLQPLAAQEIAAMTLGRFASLARMTGGRLPVLLLPAHAQAQVVEAQDVADVVGRVVLARATGAYNVANDPVLPAAELAKLFGGRHVPAPSILTRALLDATFRLGLQRLNPSWLDVALHVPLLDCAKARVELGWQGTHDARTVVKRLREALAVGDGAPAPPL